MKFMTSRSVFVLLLILIVLSLTACQDKSDKPKTMDDYNKTIASNPNDATAYYERGNAYLKQHYISKMESEIINSDTTLNNSINDYNKAIELNQSYAEAYAQRCLALGLKFDDNATKDCDKAIVLNPKLALAYKNKGDVYAENERYGEAGQEADQETYNEAKASINKAIEINSKYAEAYISLCYLHWLNDKNIEALSSCNKSIEIDPNNPMAYITRAIIYAHRMLDDEKAMQDWNKAVEIDPSYTDARLEEYELNFSWLSEKETYKRGLVYANAILNLSNDTIIKYNVLVRRGDLYRETHSVNEDCKYGSSERCDLAGRDLDNGIKDIQDAMNLRIANEKEFQDLNFKLIAGGEEQDLRKKLGYLYIFKGNQRYMQKKCDEAIENYKKALAVTDDDKVRKGATENSKKATECY